MATTSYIDTASSVIGARLDNIFQIPTQQDLARITKRAGEESIRKNTCEVCGCESKLGFFILHHIVPEHAIRQMGIADSRTVRLCINCHSAVHDWYSKKVFSMPYDLETHSFRPKLATEMAREYETAYEDFTKHKSSVKYSSRSFK